MYIILSNYWEVIKRSKPTANGGSTWIHLLPIRYRPLQSPHGFPWTPGTAWYAVETCGNHHQKLQWKHFLKPEIPIIRMFHMGIAWYN